MSLFDIQALIFRLKHDRQAQERFKIAPDSILAEFELMPEEEVALRSADLATLWQMGVHPLLLLPYSRAVGISPENYHKALAPLVGTRNFRS
jgi:hypothetical protein